MNHLPESLLSSTAAGFTSQPHSTCMPYQPTHPSPALHSFAQEPPPLPAATVSFLPAEIFPLIFSHLAQKALHQCLFVSRFWHDPAEARLYSDILIDLKQKERTDSLFQALRTRKHLLRRVEWRPYGYCRKALEANLLHVLLDYPPSPPLNDSDSNTSTGHLAYSSTSLASYTVLTNAYGPNRPGLTEFTFKGVGATDRLLQTILFNLTPTTLTRLNLDFDYGEFQVFTVDVERILDYFPRLKHLSITGWMHKYAPVQAPHVDTNDTMAAGATRGLDCGLETLRFASILMCREGPEAFLFLRRLGFLRKLVTGSQVSYPEGMLKSRPWAFGRALKESCPKLESIEIQGALVFWLFDLPVLLPSKVPHLKSLIEGLSSNEAGDLSSEAQDQSEDQLRLRLAEQELGELLEGKTAVPFFPQLKTLVLAVGHSLSAQDLISLGVQARFLTHLKILFQPTKERIAWNVYENDAPASVRTDVHSPVTVIDTLVENRRLQKRRPFNNRDVILFLQLCSSLKFLSLRGVNILFEDLVDPSVTSTTDPTLSMKRTTTPTTTTTTTASAAAATTTTLPAVIQPWACEDTLETLDIRLTLWANRPADHGHVWRHLGRLRRLRSLTLTNIIPSHGRSCLIPSFAYGVEGLLGEGERGGMSDTLVEIHSLTNWRKVPVEDRRQWVLWFARSFPKLRVLGLSSSAVLVEREREKADCAFLEDEAVKRCSIERVFCPDDVFSRVLKK